MVNMFRLDLSRHDKLSCATFPALLDHTADSLPKATKADVESHFASHGTGEITEIKLMNGFGFIEYKDAMDARDVVPGKSLLPNLILILSVPRLTSDVYLSQPSVCRHPVLPTIANKYFDPV